MAEENKPDQKKQEEKTVGEILKEEGIITEAREDSGSKVRLEEEIDLKQTVMKIEKLEAQVTALKEIKFQSDERIKELAESIGELRSMLFQRDMEIRENIAKVGKLGEVVDEIKPEKIVKEMHRKDEDLDKTRVEMEKIDTMSHDLLKRVSGLEQILDNIKSMENLVAVSKEIEDKLQRIDELNADSKKNAGKIEKFYLDMDRKMSQLSVFEKKLEKLEDLSKELVDSSDSMKIQIKNLVSREDMETVLKDMFSIPDSYNVEEMATRKNELESLVKNLKEQYEKGIISQESYEEVVNKNVKLLEQLEEKLKEYGSLERPKDIQAWMERTDKAIRDLETKLAIDEENLDRIDTVFKTTKVEHEVSEMHKVPETGEKEVPLSGGEKEEELDIDDIKSFLISLEDEYRKGIISEDTYKEVRERNLEKIRNIEEGKRIGSITKERMRKVPGGMPVDIAMPIHEEIRQIKNKIASLKERNIDTSELESLLKTAQKKIAVGYRSIAKIYLDFIKERLMNYGWS